jgi:hypothetical protein
VSPSGERTYFEIVEGVLVNGGGQTTVENNEMNTMKGIVVMSDAMDQG